MAIVTTDNQHYTDIAAAIRSKNGTETLYKPSEMAAAIQAISGGGEPEPPDDGKTRLYITVPANAMPDRPPPRNRVPLYIQQTVANGVTIDWGDGTAPETLPGTGEVNTTHTYEQAGDYVISLDPAEGCKLNFGKSSGSYCVLGNITNSEKIYCSMLQKMHIGKNITYITNYAFQSCNSLISVVISNGVTRIGNDVFSSCSSLTSIIIPDEVTSIWNAAFQYCKSLTSIIIPNGVTDISDNTFQYCESLTSIIIPDGVTTIGDYAFASCYGMKEYHFLSNTPPTLSATKVFYSIPSDCIIYVPKGSLEAYKTATNWTTYSRYIQEEPA